MMIGHQQIIAARAQRLRPVAIFIDFGFDPGPIRFPFEDPEKALHHKLYPVVTIRPSENWRLHDLRFVAGCRVHLHGTSWTDDFIGFAERLVESGAGSLIACCPSDNNELLQWANGEWSADAN